MLIKFYLHIYCSREARELDMSKVYTPGVEKPLLSFLCNGWALLSDIDIESERLRCLGACKTPYYYSCSD